MEMPFRAPVEQHPADHLTLEEFSELVRLVYHGSTESIPWQSLLQEIGRLLDANWVTLVLRRPATDRYGLVLVWKQGFPVRVATAYNQYAYAIDPFVNLPPDSVLSLDEVISDEALMAGEFYRQFLEPEDIGQMLGFDFHALAHAGSQAAMHGSGMVDCHFRVCRPGTTARFSGADRALLRILLPHLKLAVQLHSQGDVLESERELYAGTMDRMQVGMVILDESGKVLKVTAMAADILKENDGISIARGSVEANYREEDRDLQRLIVQALATATKWKPAVPEALSISRPSGRTKLGVFVRAIPLKAWSEGRHRPSVAVVIRDPERKSEASHEIMRNLFGFTPAEASLAIQLANGCTLEEASENLGIRKNTARAHLRSTFSKTGVTRQTMLVRLILSSISIG
ncbi:MAG: helix-turn-helix transcriptional regulator [Comamonas sp.]